MNAEKYQVKTSVIDSQRVINGILTLYIDGYTFNGSRKSINWENTVCKHGVATIRLTNSYSEKPYVFFQEDEKCSERFFVEDSELCNLIKKTIEFNAVAKMARIDAEQRERNEKKLLLEGKISEKKKRIIKEVDNCATNYQAHQDFFTIPNKTVEKAVEPILHNPYRFLGVSCISSNEEANDAFEKIKKLTRLNAIQSYKSPFDINGIEKPNRALSIVQHALTEIKDKSNKWFWFREADSCIAWKSEKYRNELMCDGKELGTYDLFLANYMFAILFNSDFCSDNIWIEILNYYCYICSEENFVLLKSRFSEKELTNTNDFDLLNNFKKEIFKPILILCDKNVLSAIKLFRCIEICNNNLLDELKKTIIYKMYSWCVHEEENILSFIAQIKQSERNAKIKSTKIREKSEKYCQIVEVLISDVLKSLDDNSLQYDMFNESFTKMTSLLMLESIEIMKESTENPIFDNAIYFAVTALPFCNIETKKTLYSLFGFGNLKIENKKIQHTSWDIIGDNYYFGKNGFYVDFAQAAYWYEKAAEKGNMYSQNSLGICYQNGQGVFRDYSQAAIWFEKSYENGNPEGAYNLAECYYYGRGKNKSVYKAFELLAKAAALGHPNADDRAKEIMDIERNHI